MKKIEILQKNLKKSIDIILDELEIYDKKNILLNLIKNKYFYIEKGVFKVNIYRDIEDNKYFKISDNIAVKINK